MKPEQFIREYGVDKAREVVEGAPGFPVFGYCTLTGNYIFKRSNATAYYHNETNSWSKDYAIELILLEDLKRLVESVDLIEKLGGYGKCKFYMTGMKLNKCDSVKCPKTGLIVSRAALEIAINDYRESIYGGGDE
ncbi:hypothetical protein [Acinetobacter baumannii]|uniref:hypothetical protein n=1 Tax=Acinetobacter baumannii TaxID=470 RepID=UPI0011263EE7|nr:hypothetical protein [Acinetobacter baumannii]TPT82312.1 hypothetical protein FJU59_07750 [Acinetobacter baumannii]